MTQQKLTRRCAAPRDFTTLSPGESVPDPPAGASGRRAEVGGRVRGRFFTPRGRDPKKGPAPARVQDTIHSSRSMTRGTLKLPAPCSGAFARASSCAKVLRGASARSEGCWEEG